MTLINNADSVLAAMGKINMGNWTKSWYIRKGLPQWLRGKEFVYNAKTSGDTGSIPGSGRSPGGGHGQPTPVFLPEKPRG